MERKALRKPIQRVVMVIRDGGNIAINDAVIDKLQIKIKVDLSVNVDYPEILDITYQI